MIFSTENVMVSNIRGCCSVKPRSLAGAFPLFLTFSVVTSGLSARDMTPAKISVLRTYTTMTFMVPAAPRRPVIMP
jgi:hypothetical protein